MAAIEEILLNNRKRSHVLVCSSSNAACDEIFERLLPIFNSNDILRLYASSYDRKKLKDHYIGFCNYNDETRSFDMPELKYLYGFGVIICTLSVAGNLVRANDHPLFRPDHFSHVIIDESASTHETLTMVPIAGI